MAQVADSTAIIMILVASFITCTVLIIVVVVWLRRRTKERSMTASPASGDYTRLNMRKGPSMPRLESKHLSTSTIISSRASSQPMLDLDRSHEDVEAANTTTRQGSWQGAEHEADSASETLSPTSQNLIEPVHIRKDTYTPLRSVQGPPRVRLSHRASLSSSNIMAREPPASVVEHRTEEYYNTLISDEIQILLNDNDEPLLAPPIPRKSSRRISHPISINERLDSALRQDGGVLGVVPSYRPRAHSVELLANRIEVAS